MAQADVADNIGSSVTVAAGTYQMASLQDIFKSGIELVENGVDMSEVVQGQCGDCWVLAGIAAVAEYAGWIESLFATHSYTAGQPMVVKLYDRQHNQWVNVHVNDSFPIDANHNPAFAQAPNHEAWVIVLEKAMAILCGGYDKLDAGSVSHVSIEMLTGMQSHVWYKPDGGTDWHVGDPLDGKSLQSMADSSYYCKEVHTMNDVFQSLCSMDLTHFPAAAGSTGTSDKEQNCGIVCNHMYTLWAAKSSSMYGLNFVRLRNPWGKGEWDGLFAEGTATWSQYPGLAQELGMQSTDKVDDGEFWILWDDVVQHFSYICVAHSS